MSAKCKICGTRIFDEDGQCYGVQLVSGDWVCDTADCSEFILGVVQAARAVVAAQDDDTPLLDAEIAGRRWGTIEKLREALAE